MWTSRGSSAGERLDSLSVCWGNALIVLSKALYVIVLCISLHRVLLPHVVSYDEEVYSMRGPRPNILFFLTDDHAAPAIGCYDGRLNQTPNIDAIASGGVRFNRALVTNSLCAPSRATILTGTYSHINGVTTLDTPIDARQPTFASLLHDSGMQRRSSANGIWGMAVFTIREDSITGRCSTIRAHTSTHCSIRRMAMCRSKDMRPTC